MCGVFGYVGPESDVGATIISALQTLEYRGYDSWGLAIATPGELILEKDVGRINGVHRSYPSASIGIGHTRWATHGGITPGNAHPHTDCSRRVAVVHNGIIENHVHLRAELQRRGHDLASETDSEVVAHLVEEKLVAGVGLVEAVASVFARLHGYNAIVVMDAQDRQIAATKNVSPLVLGETQGCSTVASDAIALHEHADCLTYLEDDHLAVLSADGLDLFQRGTLRPITPVRTKIEDQHRERGLAGFPDFMSKEIAEQPETLRRLVEEGRAEIEELAAAVRAARHVVLVGCGTAGHAALAGSYLFDALCRLHVAVVPASELRYRARAIDSGTLVVALSQSGETVDVLDALAEARQRGARLAAIVNTPHSTLARMVDIRLHLRAGAEQCVLATKSYTAKLAALLLVASAVEGRWHEGGCAVMRAAEAISPFLHDDFRQRVREIAVRFAGADHLFVIGRGTHYPSALEAALKIKEVSYIHAEGFAAGELKHGVIALVDAGVPCLVFAPDDATRVDILSAAAELRSRGATVIGIGSRRDDVFDDFIEIADAGIANPIVEAVPAQLFAYFAAVARGNDPDRPRNLAKSVTVK